MTLIEVGESITIKELAKKMQIDSSAIIKNLFLQGKVVTINEEVTFEEAEEIAMEFNILVEEEVVIDEVEEILKEEEDAPDTLKKRSPGRGIKPIIKDGVVYSDGTTILGGDDKAGIAAIMEALEIIKEKNIPHGDIEISFSIYEEGGLHGAKNLDYSKIKSKLGFVFDSGGQPGHIAVQGPGQNKIDVKFIGKEAHAGVAPENGISAIQMASEAISNMKLLRIDEETTANIGSIKGGEATNIVTPIVEVVAESRSLDGEKLKVQTDHMVKCCKDAADKFGGQVEIKVSNVYTEFKVDKEDEIVKMVIKACHNLGLDPITTTTGGGSDTNVFNQKGIQAVNLGMGGRRAHTLEEHVYIEELEDTARDRKSVV